MPQLELQAQLMSFADRMAVTLSGVWEPVEFGDTTPELRSMAHSLWFYPSVAASGIATAPDSEAGLLDMVVMVTLLRMTIEDYWVPQVFGEQAPGAIAAYQTLEADIWGVANEALTPQQAQELHALIQRWRAANPDQHNVTYYRFSAFARKGRRSSFPDEGQPGGLLAKVSEVTRAADETLLLTERALYKADRMPIFAAAQAKQMFYDLMRTREFKQIMFDTGELPELGERFAVLAETLPLNHSHRARGGDPPVHAGVRCRACNDHRTDSPGDVPGASRGHRADLCPAGRGTRRPLAAVDRSARPRLLAGNAAVSDCKCRCRSRRAYQSLSGAQAVWG
jgi:hypothetical protein